MNGFLLGLANGATCLAYCAPVLIPLMLGEGQRIQKNWELLGKFLGGRLVGYLLFGLLAWITGQMIVYSAIQKGVVFGTAYMLLAALLLSYGLAQTPEACPTSLKTMRGWLRNNTLVRHWPALLPLGLGFFTGLNLCPPFLAAFAQAAQAGSLGGSLVLFAAFFVGTAVFTLPVTFVGFFNQVQALRTIGKFAAVMVAVYYLFSGIFLFVGALS